MLELARILRFLLLRFRRVGVLIRGQTTVDTRYAVRGTRAKRERIDRSPV